MKGLFWNCRALRKKGLAPYVRELISGHDFEFICFQETILQDLLLGDWILVRDTYGTGFLLGEELEGWFLLLKLIGLMCA
jgi:hypothetical protein